MNNEIQRLMNLSEDELYLDIGLAANPDLNFLDKERKYIEEVGRNWFKNNVNKIKRVICKEEVIDSLSKDDKLMLISAIADLLAGLYLEVSPVTVAVLVVKQGVNNLCEEK